MDKKAKCECGHELREPKKKYILLKVVDEDVFLEIEMKAKLLSLTPILTAKEIDGVKLEKMEVERLVGTRFFRLDASKYFGVVASQRQN